MSDRSTDARHMARAIELARRGEGRVEPNPMVGCVIVDPNGNVLGEGWHQGFGGPHAEVEALRAAGSKAREADMFVSLEPCCHTGKTPPCTEAIIGAGLARVVIAAPDPFPQVAGRGAAILQAAGIRVELGIGAKDAHELLAPYIKLTRTGRPWVIAKWAMTLDGKIATSTGDSQWISSTVSRRIVQTLRGRVDAIVVGRGTADTDNPLLTARPPGPRIATRIVVDTQASLALHSQLVQTAGDAPVLVAAGSGAPADRCRQLEAAGVEVLRLPIRDRTGRLTSLLDELGRRRKTNVLVEGGGILLGSLLDAGAIDEVHAFVAGKLVGGATAPSPITGNGIPQLAHALHLDQLTCQMVGGDVHIHGRVRVCAED